MLIIDIIMDIVTLDFNDDDQKNKAIIFLLYIHRRTRMDLDACCLAQAAIK